jgi:hypothetical protein
VRFFDAFKKSRSEVNRENQHQGKAGEEQIKQRYEFNGYEVERTGKGHDLKAKRLDWLTGKKETKYIEVKTGNSPLSRLQKKKKRQMGSKYVVERLEPTPLGFVTKEPKEKRKVSKGRLSSFDSMFDTTRNSRARKIKSTGYDGLFGTGSPKSRKRKSDPLNTLFGSGSSPKRPKSSGYDSMFGLETGYKSSRRSSGYDNLWSIGSTRKRRSNSSFW